MSVRVVCCQQKLWNLKAVTDKLKGPRKLVRIRKNVITIPSVDR